MSVGHTRQLQGLLRRFKTLIGTALIGTAARRLTSVNLPRWVRMVLNPSRRFDGVVMHTLLAAINRTSAQIAGASSAPPQLASFES